MDPALQLFDPVVARWFSDEVGSPTPIQREAWPAIASGRHLLLAAPTGSGKTLAAFLFALDRWLSGTWSTGVTRVLYVSPLKALAVDVRRNLLGPLAALRQRLRDAGRDAPEVQVAVRSGDTPPDERARLRRHPPDILVTTPESLNLMLSSPAQSQTLRQVQVVILDEIHAVAGSKRGTWLMAGIEALAGRCGEPQRLALSATARPLEQVAAFVAGFSIGGSGASSPRPIQVLAPTSERRTELRIETTDLGGRDRSEDGLAFFHALAGDLRPRIRAHRSTLIFTNSRRLAEKLARVLNEDEATPLVYTHHGSLSRELRLEVERRLKQGLLPAVVATNSLELGIDVGDCEQVILVQTPRRLASAVQRLGRAGHRVDQVSRGSLHPTHGHDLLEAAALAPAMVRGEVEALRPVRAPLDVLTQIIVRSVLAGEQDLTRIFEQTQGCWSFSSLRRPAFDLVVDMLCGRGRALRGDTTRPLLQRLGQAQVQPTSAARAVFNANAGVIPERGLFRIRLEGSGARLGDLDEEFVWERNLGDTFTIGTQSWRIVGFDHDDVRVQPAPGGDAMAPFWKAEAQDRDLDVAERIGDFLEQVDAGLDQPDLRDHLQRAHHCSAASAEVLLGYLERQQRATHGLPHRHRLVAEHCPDSGGQGHLLVLHAQWGGRVLRPLAIALDAAWRRTQGAPLPCSVREGALLIQLAEDRPASTILSLVDADNLDLLLRQGLVQSGLFGAAFRENAGRALLLRRRSLNRRRPLWMVRQRAKRLLERARNQDDFPVLAETWRSCLEDQFDLAGLRRVLDELSRGDIRVDEVRTASPSPFAADVVRDRVNTLMYDDDAPGGQGPSSLSQRVLEQVLGDAARRPRLAAGVMAELEGRLHRIAPGYAPESSEELVRLVRERWVLPWPRWQVLLAACADTIATSLDDLVLQLAPQLCAVQLGDRAEWVVCARESMPALLVGLDRESSSVRCADLTLRSPQAPSDQTCPERGEEDENLTLLDVVADVVAREAAITPQRLVQWLGVAPGRIASALASLADDGQLILDVQVEGQAENWVCDRDMLERLLRLQRARSRPRLQPLALSALPLFLASRHGLVTRRDDEDALPDALELLFGLPCPVALLEPELLAARVANYRSAGLDRWVHDGMLQWCGVGTERIALVPASELELLVAPDPHHESGADDALRDMHSLFPEARGRYDLGSLVRHSGRSSTEVSQRLWDAAWHGLVSADSYEVLRQGLHHRFEPAPPSPVGRRGFASWRASRPYTGTWFLQETVAARTSDPLDALERDKRRVRLLLARHGVLFRELLQHELPALQWRTLQPALRAMELSGEVVSGVFFEGVRGLQFADAQLIPRWPDAVQPLASYLVHSQDPVSCCGLGLEGLSESLPARAPGTWLVYGLGELALVLRRQGQEIDVRVPAGSLALVAALPQVAHLVQRAVEPLPRLRVARIDGDAATHSPHGQVFLDAGFKKDASHLVLERSYAVSLPPPG
ncbi:MAG: DEAD/DEAH box helicase [Pseudomonadota bacterium]